MNTLLKPQPKFQPHELKLRAGEVLHFEAVYALLPAYQFPCGFIWYAQTLNNLTNIGYIWTHEYFRRHGIATRMLQQLRAWYPENSICTAVGNELSTPWLVATGFKLEKDGWFLRPPTIEPCPMI